MTPDQYLKQRGALRNGQIPVSQTINSAALAPVPSISYQNPKPVPVYPVAGLSTDPVQSLEMTAPEQKATDLTSQLVALNDRLVGESAFRAEEEAKQGIPALTQTQTDLRARLKGLQNEALAIPLQMQEQFAGRGVTAGGLKPHETGALRNNAIQALGTASLLEAANGNLTTAISLVDRAVAQRFDPIKEQIAATRANLDLILNSPEYSLAEKNRALKQQEIQEAKERAVRKEEQKMKDIHDLAIEAMRNGADARTSDAILKSGTVEEAMSHAAVALGAEFVQRQQQQKFENDLRRQQFALQQKEFGLAEAKFAFDHAIESGNAVTAQTASDLTSSLAGSKVGQATKTSIGTILGVINAAEDLAKQRPEGVFKGINPFNAVLDAKIPFLDWGLPGRNMLRSSEGTTNTGYLDAINLKVQMWASGATLTKQQTEQVNRFTPNATDTDQKVREKLNNLVNFMHQQIKGALAAEGIAYEPTKVDLFGKEKSLDEIFNQE